MRTQRQYDASRHNWAIFQVTGAKGHIAQITMLPTATDESVELAKQIYALLKQLDDSLRTRR